MSTRRYLGNSLKSWTILGEKEINIYVSNKNLIILSWFLFAFPIKLLKGILTNLFVLFSKWTAE